MTFTFWPRAPAAGSKRPRANPGRRQVRSQRRSIRPQLEPLEDRWVPVTFTVLNTLDTGTGSLRQAILDANDHANTLNTGGVADTIAFNIPGGGVQTVAPLSALPTITDPVVIDGYTQPGARPNTLANGDDAVLLIELNGGSTRASSGLKITAGGSTVQGLVMNRFDGEGIQLTGGAGNAVQGNFIGTDATGTLALGNSGGVSISSNTSNNTVGGTTPAARNVISGNARYGISISGGS